MKIISKTRIKYYVPLNGKSVSQVSDYLLQKRYKSY